ncbi:MAG: inositol monophosphatase family protein [Patescibacteria group bacterium]|jgi:myo-inositol-1(or 4)-monophosphatase
MNRFTSTAVAAAKSAGQILMKYYPDIRSTSIIKKGKHDIVTKADMMTNTAIIKAIEKVFPDHDIYSEETGLKNKPGSYKWVIDPLDGTSNYAMHIPLFCTSISLVHKGSIIISVIYAPYLNELFIAEKGKGAFLNNKRIHVSGTKVLKEAFLFLGRGHGKPVYKNFLKLQKRLRKDVINIRFIGSASMNMAYVASGRTDSYIQVPPESHLWDTAAGVLLVKEAGGQVSDFRGRPWKFNSLGVVASNGLIHQQLIKKLK